jgi:hypothetical protein
MMDMMFPELLNKKKNRNTLTKIKHSALAGIDTKAKYQADIRRNLSNANTEESINPNEIWEKLKQAVINSAVENCGRIKQAGRKRAMWWTEEVARAVECKKKKFKAWTQDKSENTKKE